MKQNGDNIEQTTSLSTNVGIKFMHWWVEAEFIVWKWYQKPHWKVTTEDNGATIEMSKIHWYVKDTEN